MKIPEFNPTRYFGAILFFGLLAMTARNATDPDLWWHLSTGQRILATGHVPHTDPFSFTRAGHAWVSHEWLSDVVFYELWKHGGAAALIAFSAFVTTAGFMLLYLRCPGKRHWAAAATAIGALASAASWGVRPQMFTFTMASLFLLLLEVGEGQPKFLISIPPLFLLWLNLHAGFALGPALMLAYAMGVLIEAIVGELSWHQARPIILRTVFLLFTCLALVPLNPSGTQLYRYPLDTLRSTGMRSFIVEWFSPDFHQSLYQPLLLVWLLLIIAISSSRPKGRVLVPLLLTAWASLDAVRHIPIFALLAMPVIASSIPRAWFQLASPEHRPGSIRWRSFFGMAVIVLLAVFAATKWTSLVRKQEAREADLFPRKAVEFLRSNQEPQRMFIYYDWGGYVIWNLHPQYQVFVDGRADLYGDDLLRQFKDAIQLHTGWNHILDGWGIQTVLVPPTSALAQALLLDNHWKTAFSDVQSIVLVRALPVPQEAELLK